MRVTNKMLSNNFLADMRRNLQNMSKLQQQMTSGKEFRRPSDDPFKVSRSMQMYREIDANKQYNENISDTINWLDTTDTALGQVGDVLQRVRELLISAGNAAYGDNERLAIKDEINEKVGELGQILNTNFDGAYIFGGTRGTTKPMDVDETSSNTKLIYYKKDGGELNEGDTEYNQIGNKLKVQIAQGVIFDYNVTATEVLQFKNSSNEELDIRGIFSDIINHLDGKDSDGNPVTDNSNIESLVNGDLGNITDAINNILKLRAQIGAKQNRMDSAKEKNQEANFNMTEILSKNEDIDITEKVMEYATMQTVYVASLQTSAKVLQPSLIDYL